MLSTDLTNANIQLSVTARHVLAVREDVLAKWEARVRAKLTGAATVAHPILLGNPPTKKRV